MINNMQNKKKLKVNSMQHVRKPNHLSRGRFVSRIVLAAGTVTIVPRFVLGGPGYTSPSDKLNIAGIGIGGIGKRFLRECSEENIIALCDVDEKYAKRVFRAYPQAKKYRDFQEMLDKEKEIDGVIIATPDHTHALICLAAIKKKKHILCVKPLTRTIHESRMVVEAAKKAKIVTNVTASPASTDGACRLVEMIQDGAIGEVKEVHCWTNRPIWPQGMERPSGEDKVPSYLDWDRWLGPALARPFKNLWPKGALSDAQKGNKMKRRSRIKVYHPFNFRGWWDFGTGSLGDMGVHYFNTLFRALKLGHPTSVEASSTGLTSEAAPISSKVIWRFPARPGMGPLKLVYYDGGLKPPRPPELAEGREWRESGVLYIGDKGKILGNTSSGRIIPEEKMKKYKLPPRRLERRGQAAEEWIDACRGKYTASCNFDVAGLLTEVVLLGNIAIRTGKKLYWDAKNLRIMNYEKANQYIR